ncbi:hypothetical protein C0993_008679 [Termitomyces sp. T159_Od127]|nr:hypothetical protein C0993_008679 [Termitomyces sp. T159_Od127]
MDAFINHVLRTLAAMPPDAVSRDEPMDTDNNDHDVPELQPLSDSDEELYPDPSQDEEEEEEVVMQTVDERNNENMPPLEPMSHTHTSSNRRPRVDDDNDDERDRRHPSQRINNPLDVTNPAVARDSLSSNGPINTPVASGMSNEASAGQDNQNQPNQNQPNQQPRPPRQRPPIINGFAVTIDINGQRIVRPLPAFDSANPGAGFADFLGFLSALSERETDDPERAKQLVDALEEVPVGLVRRLEALNGKTPTENGEGEGTVAGDCSCAICWDTLLDGEGGFWVDGDDKTQEEEPRPAEGGDASALSSPSTPTSPLQDTAPAPASAPKLKKLVSSTDPTQPKIVSLPCAHVFHAACLIPWFSRPRQTTCPTCRFNIDPERLTARRQPFYSSFDVRSRRDGRQGQQQQQQGEGLHFSTYFSQEAIYREKLGPPPTDPHTDNADVRTSPEPQAQAQAQPADSANAGQPPPQRQRNTGHLHGALPGAVLTIGFDIIIGPNPNLGGRNANPANANPDSNPAQTPVHNANMNPDAGADAENAARNNNHNHGQNQNRDRNQQARPNFMGLGMGLDAMTMGMGDMNEDEIEEVTMMDLSDAQARELGDILRMTLPHPDPPPTPATHRPPAPAAPDTGAADGGAAQSQQGEQQRPRPATGPITGVFTGMGTGRSMGEALAALFSQPLQPLQRGQAEPGAPGAQPQEQAQGEGVGQQGQAERQGQDVGEGQQQGQQAAQGQGQGPAQMPNAPALREFLNAVFASMAQAQGQGQRQTRGAGAGAGQGAQAQPQNQAHAGEGLEPEEEHENEHEQQPAPQDPTQPQNQNRNGTALPTGAGGIPGFVLAPLPFVAPAGTIGATPVFNLGNLFAGLDALGSDNVGGGGVNQSNVNNNTRTDANDEANGSHAGGNANANSTEANANPSAADVNANSNVHAPGPAMNIPFIPFSSLFPGATLTPPPAFGAAQPAQPPAQAAPREQEEEEQSAGHHQPAQADGGSPLSGFMRLLPDVFGRGINAANGTNAPNVHQQQAQPQQPQQQGDERPLPLPPWARFFQPQLFNPFNVGPTPAAAGVAQAQSEEQPQQAQAGTDDQVPPTGPARARRGRAPREKKSWTLPAPPGPTLRQRIEKREREAGLRCYDISCGVGPSDEEPFVGAGSTEGARRQLSICTVTPEGHEKREMVVCEHTFHPACLVSAARVANALGEDVSVGQGDFVEVSCSVCRGVGSVRKEDWDEGVTALA